MTQLYGLNSCLYDNCDKKIIIKEKEGKRQGKKKRMSDETSTWELNANITVLPQGTRARAFSPGASLQCRRFLRAREFFLAKAHVETRKEGRKWGESKGAG